MDKEKMLNQANYLLKKVLNTKTLQEQDLLEQEIRIYLKQFQPKPRHGKYRQIDIEESINDILKKTS